MPRCEVIIVDGNPPTRPQILQAVREAAAKPGGLCALFWWSKVNVDEELLDAAGPNLKAVCTMSSGLDKLDLDAIRKRGILIGNTLHVLDDSVANVAVGLVLSATRRFHEGRRIIESGVWVLGGSTDSPQWLLGHDLAGSTVGIVGFGGVGSAIANKLRAFDVGRIVYSGRTDKPNARELGAERVPLADLLRESDIVVAACPYSPETHMMFNADAFKQMKKEATFVNVGRGLLVDQDALISALKTGEIFAAGLDVMTPEPLPPDHPLLKLPNAVVIPHMGSATYRTRETMAVLTAQNILAALNGEPMPCQVK